MLLACSDTPVMYELQEKFKVYCSFHRLMQSCHVVYWDDVDLTFSMSALS